MRLIAAPKDIGFGRIVVGNSILDKVAYSQQQGIGWRSCISHVVDLGLAKD